MRDKEGLQTRVEWTIQQLGRSMDILKEFPQLMDKENIHAQIAQKVRELVCQEQAEMLFLLAILAGRKYNTAGFQLLSKSTFMNIESLRDDPTAKQLIELLFPDKITEAEDQGKAQGITEGIKKATENFIRRFSNVLSEEQMKQLKEEGESLAFK